MESKKGQWFSPIWPSERYAPPDHAIPHRLLLSRACFRFTWLYQFKGFLPLLQNFFS